MQLFGYYSNFNPPPPKKSAGPKKTPQTVSPLKKNEGDRKEISSKDKLTKRKIKKEELSSSNLKRSQKAITKEVARVHQRTGEKFRIKSIQEEALEANENVVGTSSLYPVGKVSTPVFYNLRAVRKEIPKYVEENSQNPKEDIENIEIILKRATVLYSKDEVINLFRIELAQADEKNHKAIIKIIRTINEESSPFITAKKILAITNAYLNSFKLPFNNLNGYVSNLELANLLTHSRSKVINNFFKKHITKKFFVNQFAFKISVENEREILAAKSASILGLNKVLLTKSMTTLKRTEFSGRDPYTGVEIFEPTREGIMSEWLPEDLSTFNLDDYEEYFQLNRDRQRAIFLEDEEALEQIRPLLERSEDRLLLVGSRENYQMHALLDLLYLSGDSHPKQYKIGDDGIIYNLDFSRFLPPNPFMRYNNGDLEPFLISTFIDHPAASSLERSLVKLISSWDLKEIRKQHIKQNLVNKKEWNNTLKGLIQLKELTENVKDCLLCNRDDYTLINKNKEYIHKIYRNVLKKDPPKTEIYTELCEECDMELRKLEKLIIQKAFQYILPTAFEQFMERLEKTQKYVITTIAKGRKPSLRELMFILYPELKPFYVVVERITGYPGISFRMSGTPGFTLKHIIEIAEGKMSFKKEPKRKWATDEEIDAMKAALKAADANSFSFDAVIPFIHG